MINLAKGVGVMTSILLGVCICMLPIYLVINYYYNSLLVDEMNEISDDFKLLRQAHHQSTAIKKRLLELHRAEIYTFKESENRQLTLALDTILKNYKKHVETDTTLSESERADLLMKIQLTSDEYEKHVKLFQNLMEIDKRYVDKQLNRDNENSF